MPRLLIYRCSAMGFCGGHGPEAQQNSGKAQPRIEGQQEAKGHLQTSTDSVPRADAAFAQSKFLRNPGDRLNGLLGVFLMAAAI